MDRTVGGRVPGGRVEGGGSERLLNVRDEGGDGEGRKARNTEESRHPGTLFTVQMTPLTFSQWKDVPASDSVHHVDSNS